VGTGCSNDGVDGDFESRRSLLAIQKEGYGLTMRMVTPMGLEKRVVEMLLTFDLLYYQNK
jgi:hypothetical protein